MASSCGAGVPDGSMCTASCSSGYGPGASGSVECDKGMWIGGPISAARRCRVRFRRMLDPESTTCARTGRMGAGAQQIAHLGMLARHRQHSCASMDVDRVSVRLFVPTCGPRWPLRTTMCSNEPEWIYDILPVSCVGMIRTREMKGSMCDDYHVYFAAT